MVFGLCKYAKLAAQANYCTNFNTLLSSLPIASRTMKAFSILSIAALIGLLNIPNTANAQVLIPDTMMRNWLNTRIPGIVDANGIMDTLNPGIASLDTAQFTTPSFPSTPLDSLNLEGIQYLNALRSFTLDVTQISSVVVTSNALPAGLRSLTCRVFGTNNVTFDLPQLPPFMDRINLAGGGDGSTLSVLGLPDHVTNFVLNGFETVSWQGSPHADTLTIDEPGLPTGPMPQISAGTMLIIMNNIHYADLSNVSTPELILLNCYLAGPINLPQHVETLQFPESTFAYPLETIPSSVKKLNLGRWLNYCLPVLPDSLILFTLEFPGEFPCIPNWPSGLSLIRVGSFNYYPGDVNYCSVLNSDCPGVYPGISGNIFVDLNENGIHDAGEPPLPQASVTVEPGSNVAPCDVNGYWEIGVPPGNYSISPSSTYPYIASTSPTQHTADLPTMGSADTLNDFAVTLMPDIEDLQAFIYAFHARPGFDNEVHLSCRNYGTVPMDAQLTFQFDPDQSWVGSSIAPDVLVGNTATWDLNSMAIGATTNITVDLHTATTVPLGTGIDHMLTALPDLTDETPADNTVLWSDSVVGSYDPNDKLLSPATMTPAEVQLGNKRIEYIIRYQNTGTAAAERVVIADTLPAGLQLESIRFDGSSLPCSWYLQGGVLYFVHEGINLPDSTSDPLGSQGFVRFSILPETDLVNGEAVANIAHIVFDFNEPVVTPPAVFTVNMTTGIAEERAPSVRVLPNPAHDQLFVSFRSGERPTAVQVRDAMGRTVLQPELNRDGALNISTLPAGIYLLEAKGKRSTAQVRFVKQ